MDVKTHFGTTQSITCGSCGRAIAANVLHAEDTTVWMRCPACKAGSVRNLTTVSPPAPAGEHVNGLPEDVAQAWREARTTHAVAAYTASEMMCRKILMHVAVGKAGSKAGQNFTDYVGDLCKKGYVPAGLDHVVDKIRARGNGATHDLPASTEDESRATLMITQHLLKGVYELAVL